MTSLLHATRDRNSTTHLPTRSSSSSSNILVLFFGAIFLFAAGVIVGTNSLFLQQQQQGSYFEDSTSGAMRALSSFASSTTTDALLFTRPETPITIGYAISLIKCQDKQSTPEGLVDAAIVLRHSIHLAHEKSPHYNYRMYAFVHTQAEECSGLLQDAGFTVQVRDPPVQAYEIHGEILRNNIDKEWCCGSAEFLKLYAYQLLDVPIVVHMDMDFLMLKPMDHVMDAILYDASSEIGSVARKRLEREFPNTPLPEQRIDAMVTRDWPQVIPGRKAGFQAGFWVVRPNPGLFELTLDIIRKGDYVEGYGRDNGWGGRGYGAFVGAQAMQGLMAFVYDAILYDTTVELNQCRYNHIGMDVRYRAPPAFMKHHAKVGGCRNDGEACEDCMVTPVSQIYNVHFNQCRKPWNCIGEGSRQRPDDKFAIPQDQVHLDHCLELATEWHTVRSDLERKLQHLLEASTSSLNKITTSQSGNYKVKEFQGHCMSYGKTGYLRLVGGDEPVLKRLPELYA